MSIDRDDEQHWTNILDRVMTVWSGKPYGELDAEDYEDFSKFIGFQWKGDGHYIVDITKPAIQEILRTLNGPHAKALLKVIELRNKEKANDGL